MLRSGPDLAGSWIYCGFVQFAHTHYRLDESAKEDGHIFSLLRINSAAEARLRRSVTKCHFPERHKSVYRRCWDLLGDDVIV